MSALKWRRIAGGGCEVIIAHRWVRIRPAHGVAALGYEVTGVDLFAERVFQALASAKRAVEIWAAREAVK